jgi:dipeptidase
MRPFVAGTRYDMTKGVAAGPWGDPDRWNSGSGAVNGAWERSIGLYRTAHTHLVQSRSWLPDSVGGLLWYGPHSAPGTCFVPLAAGMTSVPAPYTVGDPKKLDRTSAYWAHRCVGNETPLAICVHLCACFAVLSLPRHNQTMQW